MVFEGAGQSKGLEIWRIEDFAPVPYDEKQYGKFHVGDSFIVLNTKEERGKCSWDVHFWLGSETSQDESGSAALLTVELDDVLGGGPVQHRELQGEESQLFLSYFRSGLRYLPGGVKSGFNKFDPEDVERRLFRVKGKRNVQIMEVPLSVSSLNRSDCFILDGGKNHGILVLMPPGARKMEQFRATQVANEIRDEDHAGNAEVEIIDNNFDKFFETLGEGSMDEIPEDDGDDEETSKMSKKTIKLYKIEDNSTSIVSEAPLKQEMLESDNAYIVYGGAEGIFVWIGKGASKEEKIKVFDVADKLIADNGLKKGTKITRVVEGIETAIFKQFFASWNETGNINFGFGRQYSAGSVTEWNVEDLHFEARKHIAKSAGTAIGFMPDEGTGTKTVWRVEKMELVEVAESDHGFLYDGDCYVILYSYGDSGHIVYFWQGENCSIDERGASAIHAARIDNEDLAGGAIQVRVVQGQEPRHFIKMFAGNMVVLKGGKQSGFRNVSSDEAGDAGPNRVFRVQCVRGEMDARATQVTPSLDSISTDDVFILYSGAEVIIWFGATSNAEEATEAGRLASKLYPDITANVVQQGEEPAQFWTILGAEAGAEITNTDNVSGPVLSPRLFHVTARRAWEISHFKRSDLVVDDVMLLDSGDEVYLWLGEESDQEEANRGRDLAKQYLDADPTPRNADNSIIITVKQNQEPESFKMLFETWD